MPDLGRKYTCYSCHTKFYDLGKPVPLCPKCGADQRDADEAPVYTAPRRSRVVEPEAPDEEEFTPAPAAGGEESDEEADDTFVPAEEDREDDADDEEEEEY